MLHLATVPSPHAHARIIRIDTRQAAQAPGVIAVIVGDDLPAWMESIPQNLYLPSALWYPLAVGKARYAGEWVAAVVATSRYQVDIGGSYGNKCGHKQIFLTCVASRIVGRPVKFIEDRLENMAAGDAHGPNRLWDVKVACDDQGKILGLDLTVIDDAGAYAGRGCHAD